MNYTSVINEFENKKVLIVGDLMLDKYIFGTSTRISPEAPVPVISLNSTDSCLGGAANVAKNIIDLGAKTYLVGTVGNDESGKELTEMLTESGIRTKNVVKDRGMSTTIKTRVISDNQQLLRIDEETVSPLSNNIQNQLLNRISRIMRMNKPDAVIISDYDKGVITTKIARETIRMAKKSGAFIAVDPKGSDFKKYSGSNVITPNRKEAEHVTENVLLRKTDLVNALKKICRDCATEGALITMGKEGVILLRGKKISEIPAIKKHVYDVTGAGDTFISSFTLSAVCSESWETAAYIANVCSSLVISSIGTTSVTGEELMTEIENLSHSYSKNKSVDELAPVLEERKRKGEKVVFTNGCFDILHTGHLKILKESRKLGDLLVVGLNSDRSVRRLKGKDRPVINETDRATMISSFKFVDYVVIFNEDTPINLIRSIKPDVITKGGDYKKDQVVGKKTVEKYGGKVRIIPLEKNKSTSNILLNIRKND